MSSEPRVVSTSRVDPDPSIARAVGRHHTFETAVADIIDNSVDAGAVHVLVRFLESKGSIIGLQIVDDGRGMDRDALESAMVFARQRDYGEEDLGHFGVGMKAASLSQADELRVYSKHFGSSAAGSSIRAQDPTEIASLDPDDVQKIIEATKPGFALETGTVIEWARPRTFLTSTDPSDRRRWISDRVSALSDHLGIVFHRLIQAGTIAMTIDVFDVTSDESGIPIPVRAIDPFGYSRIASSPLPARFEFQIAGYPSSGEAHVWPAAETGAPGFRLGGRPGSLSQGFYFYRHDRLVQIGGWNTLVVGRPELELARIAIEMDDRVSAHSSLNPEKAGIEIDDDLRSALSRGRLQPIGLDFSTYLLKAEGDRRESRRYTKRPVELMSPSRGFGSELKDAFAASVELSGTKVDIRWRVMASESPFELDVDNKTIWLNDQYREVISGHRSMDPDDAPLIKTLLMILFSKYLDGEYLGSHEKLEVEAWGQLMTAALRDEIRQQAMRMEDE